jgi:hypothetical protein
MGKYAHSTLTHLDSVSAVIETIDDPHHRAILRNYQRHVALEQCGRWTEILVPEMTIDHPVYHVKFGPDLLVLDGREAVGDWYSSMGGTAQVLMDEKLAVHDWGLASHSDHVVFGTGHELAAQGFEIADLDASYMVKIPIAMFWFYTEDAKLIGERLYQLEDPVVEAADPDDLLTEELMVQDCETFLSSVV